MGTSKSKWLAVGTLLVLALAALLTWRLTARTPLPEPEAAAEGYRIWTAAHLKDGLRHKDFTLVNVHIPFEGRIANTDLEIPYDKIADNLAKLPQSKDAKIILYCRSGRMSDMAAAELVRQGYTNVFSLAGGMLSWEEAGGKLQ